MPSVLEGCGSVNLNRLASDASWQRVMQRAENAKAKVEASEGRALVLDENEREELRDACHEFEAIFLGYLLQQMRKTVQKSSLMPETPAERIYMTMFDDEVAKAGCKGAGTGLGDVIYDSLINTMEEQSDDGETESANVTGEESAKVTGLTYRKGRW
ncbi:MAG: rod-binding protein [Candidatus Coatesbacteria bacterium]|nr:rod-binding protein [Candidatus Coatesbacteria bacterium]